MSSNPLEELFASTPEDLAGTEPDENSTGNQQQLTAIGPFLRDLRGARSLRQLQDETGIAYSYLSDIERGSKRPGQKVLSRLATYHHVPVQDLLEVAGVLKKENAGHDLSAADIRRSFRFVLDDPSLVGYQKPTKDMPIEAQRFVVQLYEHFTGKRLLD